MKNKEILRVINISTILLVISCLSLFPTVNADENDKLAVVIGVEGGGAQHLDNDAIDYANVLQSIYGYQSDHIILLTNSQGTKEAVSNALNWLINQETNASVVTIFFSTHGSNDILHLYDDDLTDSELSAFIAQIETEKILIVINACNSGSFLDIASSAPGGIVITATQADELTYDIENYANTVFIEHFVDQGMLQFKADANEDGIVTAEEAFVYAEAKCNPPPGPLVIPRTHPQMADNYEGDFDLSTPVHAPWFTSLALAMLIGTIMIYYKKKKIQIS